MTLPATLDPIIEASWDGSGDFDGPEDDITNDTLADPGLTIDQGKDGARSLSPPKVDTADLELDNHTGRYSQEQSSSPIYQQVLPGRPVRVSALHGIRRTYRSHTLYRDHVPYRGRALYRLSTTLIDDISLDAGIGNQRVSLSTLGEIGRLVGQRVTVAVQSNIRTDQALVLLLNAAGWPADKRDISIGDSTMLYWWCDERSPWEAMLELLLSEGPGALWTDGDGVLHFENRNYRTITTRSTTSRATLYERSSGPRTRYRDHVLYRARRLYRGRTSGLFFTGLQYEPGFRNVVNRATYSTRRRTMGSLTAVWSYGTDLALASGASRTLIARPSDPFLNAVTPALTTDYTVAGGTVSVSLAATSGLVAFITVTATGGTPTVSGLQLRAQPLTVASETVIQNSVDASGSIAKFGERTMQVGGWPEIDPAQAEAVCNSWVTRYQIQRPQVTITLKNADAEHLRLILEARVSDRLTLEESNTGMRGDVWVESKQLRISSAGGRSVECVLGCERTDEVAGAVWDVSLWDALGAVWGV